MMKWFRRLLLVLLVLLVVAVVALNFFLGSIVKTSVETLGPQVVGVPIQLENADFKLIMGKARLEGLQIGNPEGFSTPSCIKLASLDIELDTKSLLTDTIIINRIYVGGPEITYEQGLTGSNIGALTKQLSGDKSAEKKSDDEPEEEKQEAPAEDVAKGGKKVIIRDILVEDGRIKLSIKGLGGAAAPIPLPTVHLENVGEESEGTSIAEATKLVLGEISKSIVSVVSGSVKLVGKGAAKAGDMAIGGATKAGDLAMDGAAKAGGMAVEGASKAADVAGDGISKAGELAGDGAKAVGGAVSAGASKIIGGVGGLFGGDDDKATAEATAEARGEAAGE